MEKHMEGAEYNKAKELGHELTKFVPRQGGGR